LLVYTELFYFNISNFYYSNELDFQIGSSEHQLTGSLEIY